MFGQQFFLKKSYFQKDNITLELSSYVLFSHLSFSIRCLFFLVILIPHLFFLSISLTKSFFICFSIIQGITIVFIFQHTLVICLLASLHIHIQFFVICYFQQDFFICVFQHISVNDVYLVSFCTNHRVFFDFFYDIVLYVQCTYI